MSDTAEAQVLTREQLVAKCRAAQETARSKRFIPRVKPGASRATAAPADGARAGAGAGVAAAAAAGITPPPGYQPPLGAPSLDDMLHEYESAGGDLDIYCSKLGLPPGMADLMKEATAEAAEGKDLQAVMQRAMQTVLEQAPQRFPGQLGHMAKTIESLGGAAALAQQATTTDAMRGTVQQLSAALDALEEAEEPLDAGAANVPVEPPGVHPDEHD